MVWKEEKAEWPQADEKNIPLHGREKGSKPSGGKCPFAPPPRNIPTSTTWDPKRPPSVRPPVAHAAEFDPVAGLRRPGTGRSGGRNNPHPPPVPQSRGGRGTSPPPPLKEDVSPSPLSPGDLGVTTEWKQQYQARRHLLHKLAVALALHSPRPSLPETPRERGHGRCVSVALHQKWPPWILGQLREGPSWSVCAVKRDSTRVWLH